MTVLHIVKWRKYAFMCFVILCSTIALELDQSGQLIPDFQGIEDNFALYQDTKSEELNDNTLHHSGIRLAVFNSLAKEATERLLSALISMLRDDPEYTNSVILEAGPKLCSLRKSRKVPYKFSYTLRRCEKPSFVESLRRIHH